ncbi:PAS domain S-box protein [Porifericola rhodea]|uniref:PAS domain S-box protein n=1 Tax=Porifericola rhodea TaxID=930972 RepID=UPI0026665D89|nr:PAS domain S-box protein [Porifericola rhodea]WKN32556.1 PAS domain S-box protein [Porifericola rhodea]
MNTLQETKERVRQLEQELEAVRNMQDNKIHCLESQLKEAQEFAGIGWWTMEMGSRCLSWSEEVYRQCGRKPEEGSPSVEEYYAMLHPKDRKLVKETLESGSLDEKATFELRLFTPDQELRYIKINVKPWADEDGRKIGLFGTSLDVTDIREAEEALRKEKEKYKLITDHAQDLIAMHQPDATFTYVSPSVRTILGFEPEELIGINPYTMSHPDDIQNIEDAHFNHTIKGKCKKWMEYRLRRKDGHYVWLQTVMTPIIQDNQVIAFQTVSRDITAQRHAQEKLEISERNYRRLAANIPETDVFLFDNELRYIVADGTSMQKHGLSPERFEGKTLHEALEGNMLAYLKPIYEATLKGEYVHSDILHEGEHYNHRTVPLRDEEGEIEGGLLVSQNVSDRKRTEEALLKVKEELEEAQELARIGSWELDVKSGKLSLSPQFKKLINVSQDFCPSINHGLNFLTKRSKQLFQRYLRKTIAEGVSFDVELEMYIGNSYERLWVRTVGKPLTRSRKAYKVKGIFQDISKSKKAELRQKRFQKGMKALNLIASRGNLEFEEQIDKSLVEVSAFLGMPLGLISRIEDGQCFVEHSVRTAIGLPDLRNRVSPLSHGYCSIAYRENDIVSIRHLSESEYANHPAHAEIKMESYIGVPIRVEDKVYGIVNFMDISPRAQDFSEEEREFVCLFARWVGSTIERRRKELEIIQAKKQAEQASLAKAQFLSTMSHEIRTPLNAVIGISHLLLQDDPKPEQVENLQALRFSGENLLALINDILDFSKIEAGKIEFEKADFSIKQLLTGIQKSLSVKAEEKGISLEVSQAVDVPGTLVGDPTRLSQIMNNLVSNAIKFTPEGSVKAQVKLLSQTDKEVELYFEVLDTGIGIPEDKQSHIFDSFSQASSDTTRNYGGTGLGLAITKKLLELQGSAIELESKPGEGSRFHFKLSFLKSEQNLEDKSVFIKGAEGYKSLKGFKVLLVEDNNMNVIVARQFLNKWQLDFEHAGNGQEAVDMVTSADVYDLVLMDLQMPVMDGYNATLAIREKYPDLPIIALTASAMLEIQEKVYKVGMNDFVTKPFNPKELYQKIVRHLDKASVRT